MYFKVAVPELLPHRQLNFLQEKKVVDVEHNKTHELHPCAQLKLIPIFNYSAVVVVQLQKFARCRSLCRVRVYFTSVLN